MRASERAILFVCWTGEGSGELTVIHVKRKAPRIICNLLWEEEKAVKWYAKLAGLTFDVANTHTHTHTRGAHVGMSTLSHAFHTSARDPERNNERNNTRLKKQSIVQLDVQPPRERGGDKSSDIDQAYQAIEIADYLSIMNATS